MLSSISPLRGPKAGGSSLTIRGQRLRTGHPGEVSVLIGGVPCSVYVFNSEVVTNHKLDVSDRCSLSSLIQEQQIRCVTRGSNRTGEHGITVRFGGAERHLQAVGYRYTPNPNITAAAPSRSFLRSGGAKTLQLLQN